MLIMMEMMIDSVITEIGFIMLGGLVAVIPVYLISLMVRGSED